MFMSFKVCDGNGLPQGHRVCLNMRKIDHIAEMGQWTAAAQEMQPDDEMFIHVGNPFDAPVAPRRATGGRRPTARVRQADTFVVLPACVQIFTMNQHFTVVANYEELSKTLESLHNAFEDV